jgi:hypothetical protein
MPQPVHSTGASLPPACRTRHSCRVRWEPGTLSGHALQSMWVLVGEAPGKQTSEATVAPMSAIAPFGV